MSLVNVKSQFGVGGSGVSDGTLRSALTELRGLNVSVVSGAAANTAMNLAAIRTEDTILAAVVSTDAGGALANDMANITIQNTKAFGTLTISGNPVNGETFVVNDTTYAFKTVPVSVTDILIVAGDVTAMATKVAAAINARETRLPSGLVETSQHTPAVVATFNAGVVTITSVIDGLGNGIVLTGTATVLAATGTGTALATLTPATVVANNTFVLSGVTFTAKAVPVLETEFLVAASNLLQGIEIVRVITAYETNYGTLDAVATNHATTGVVTIVPRKPLAGNVIPLTEAATNVAVTGSGTLTSGTNTGAIKSTTTLTGKSLVIHWFNKS